MTVGDADGDVEAQRVARLLDAEANAVQLFAAVREQGLIAAGRRDREVSDAIRDLAHDLFGVQRYWHKRIVRSGPHTTQPYRANPPDRVIEADDIVLCDFGPVFEGWEADLGRTFVLGDDPVKHRMVDDLATIFAAGQAYFEAQPQITGEQLFAHLRGLVAEAGWEHTVRHAGHLIGEFPHERIEDDEISSYITAGNDQPMRRADAVGRPCHWILEVHLVDPRRGFGAFFEQLLDLHHPSPGAGG